MSYGLEVYNASGTKIITISDRLTRFVSHGTVTVPFNGYVDIPVTGMANNDTWGVALSFLGSVFQFNSIEVSSIKQVNNLRITVAEGYNPFGQTNPSTIDVTYYIFRT